MMELFENMILIIFTDYDCLTMSVIVSNPYVLIGVSTFSMGWMFHLFYCFSYFFDKFHDKVCITFASFGLFDYSTD